MLFCRNIMDHIAIIHGEGCICQGALYRVCHTVCYTETACLWNPVIIVVCPCSTILLVDFIFKQQWQAVFTSIPYYKMFWYLYILKHSYVMLPPPIFFELQLQFNSNRLFPFINSVKWRNMHVNVCCTIINYILQ